MFTANKRYPLISADKTSDIVACEGEDVISDEVIGFISHTRPPHTYIYPLTPA
jgi:hypothetical protein